MTSRLTVETARSRCLAISRNVEPEAIPREMSSRSERVSASRERRRATGGIPPRGNNKQRMELCGLSKARPISAATVPPSSDSRCHASRSQKVQTVSLASYNTTLREQTCIRWCCIDLSNAPLLSGQMFSCALLSGSAQPVPNGLRLYAIPYIFTQESPG